MLSTFKFRQPAEPGLPENLLSKINQMEIFLFNFTRNRYVMLSRSERYVISFLDYAGFPF